MKRLFSRENSRTDGGREEGIPMSSSSANLGGRGFGGSMRITDQVIEEVSHYFTCSVVFK